MASPAQLSRTLRESGDDFVRLRRWVAYQMGLVRRLPDPAEGVFDATKVDASSYAYKRLQTPDGLLMLATYAVTAILAGAGGADRARAAPWLPLAASAKAGYDVATNLQLFLEEWRSNGKLCQYCLAAKAASWISALLTLPEALAALQSRKVRALLPVG